MKLEEAIVYLLASSGHGMKPEQIAPMFLKAASLSNVSLPLSFWKVLREDASPAEEKPRRSPSEPLCRKILDALKKK